MSIKVEEVDEYDGSYVCVICSESVRDADALCCLQCSSNPFHARCVVGTAFAETCPQCAGRTVVPWTGAKTPAATSSATVDLTGSEPLLTEMDVHEGAGRWVYSGGLVVSSDGTWRPEEGGASDDGPSFAEMMGLGEDQSVFNLEEGGFLITGPGHDINGGQVVMPVDPPGFIEEVDKFGACIWRDHPALQKSFFALMGLDMDQPRAIVKKMSQVANLTGNLETLAMSLTDEVKKGRILSKASDINCRQAVVLHRVKNFSAAVTSARLALDLAERAGDEQGQAFALSVLGDALDSNGQYNESIEAYEKRIAIAEKLEDVDGHEF